MDTSKGKVHIETCRVTLKQTDVGQDSMTANIIDVMLSDMWFSW